MGYDFNRFSPMKTINKDNVKRLIPVWNYIYDDNRSEESQPLIYKGVLYVTTNSATIAIDTKTGKQLWKTKVEYPPEVPRPPWHNYNCRRHSIKVPPIRQKRFAPPLGI